MSEVWQMLEQMRAVSNPLTIIALFAALAEVASTIALSSMPTALQSIFVWFVMIFPLMLVVLFFATLNFNPTVLYAPSDFRTDDTFLNALAVTRNVSRGLSDVTHQLEGAKDRIVSEVVSDLVEVGETEKARIESAIAGQLEEIENRINQIRESADDALSEVAGRAFPHSSLQAKILTSLEESAHGLTRNEVARATYTSIAAADRALERLVARKLVDESDAALQGKIYSVARPGRSSTNASIPPS